MKTPVTLLYKFIAMTFLREIWNRKGTKRGVEVTTKKEYEEKKSSILNGIDYGITVSNDVAMRVTSVLAAIRLRSENIASLPKKITKNTLRGEESVNRHPVSRLIRTRPNEYMNVFNFWDCINASMDGWGNAYAIIERNSYGDPVALHPVLPSETDVSLRDRKKYFKVYGNRLGLDGIYKSDEVCHFMLTTLNGIKGLNPIEYNAISIAKGIAATKFGAEFYKKGGNIRAVLEADGSMSDAEFENFMRHFKESSRNYETPFLEYGIKYKPVGISPISAQLLQTETFSIQDIARIFNVPPHMLCEMSHATFSNIEHQTIQFTTFSLRPSVKRIETELETKLFFDGEIDQFNVKFDLNGLMRGDTAARSEWYRTSIQNGIHSRNEIRQMEGYPRIEGLDDMLYPSNMTIVGHENQDKK